MVMMIMMEMMMIVMIIQNVYLIISIVMILVNAFKSRAQISVGAELGTIIFLHSIF